MKKLLSIAMFLICSLLPTNAQYSGSGNGTEDDPYLIFNVNQLSQVSNFLNQNGVVFKLMKDLDLTEWIAENNPRQGWLPIGVESMPFMGKFWGNGHKVSGLMIKRTSSDYVGFFGYVSGATIENLTIEGSSIMGASNVGGFIGYASGSEITNCKLSLTSGVEGTNKVGGFIGQSYNSNFSTFNVETSVVAQSYLGGFVGLAEGGSWQEGNISGQRTGTANYVGGFAGKMTSVTLTSIKQEGDISGVDYIGGFVGCCSNGTFTHCSVESNVRGAQFVSGFAGALENTTSSFDTCFHRGTITAGGDYVGGIVGVSKGGCVEKMESCSHFGDIVGLSYVGGIIGAILNTNIVLPTLSTYTIYTNDHSGTLLYTINETYINGTSKILPINNCTSIGNIEGNDWIGGLIGSELSSYSYNSNARTESYQGKNTGFYLFKDGVYTGQHGTWNSAWGYVEFSFSHSYYRNTVSYSLANNYYSGTIHGMNNVGGLCGYKSGGNIQNNYAYANIYGVSNVGGIVGQTSANSEGESYNTTTIKSNVAVVSAVSASNQNVGRIYGVVDTEHTSIGALGSSESNRALAQAKVILSGVVQDTDDDLQNGTSVGPSALKLKANYVSWGWNFDENWNILETESYPYKKFQAAPPIIESELVSQATNISGKSIDGGTVYLYYKDRDAVSTECSNYKWNFNTEALQSGAIVQVYSDVIGLTPSYFTTATVGYHGNGTEEDPWRIYTAEDLQGVSNRGYYKVMNDIDLTQWINENSPETGWIPIGRNSGDASNIDGDGHTISGLWINNTENYNGLFSNFSTGQIKNLNVEVATGKKVKGGDYTGILIGRNANGIMKNITVKGEVEGTGHVGGVVGYALNTILDKITFDGTVTSNTTDAFAGGLAGIAEKCPITRSSANSIITTTGLNNRVGGLIGYAKDGTIDKSFVNTTLSVNGEKSYVGGLVGYSESLITQSYSSGNVTATDNNSYTGGLIGYACSPVTNCYSTADVSGTLYSAGLVGYTFSSIDKCYATGNVEGVMYGAGIVGELDGSEARLTNSVAANNILSLSAQSSWGCRVIGGYKNGAADPDMSNYALNTMQVSLNNVPQKKTDDLVEGVSKTSEDLYSQTSYISLGWDFNEIWSIDSEYPFLYWNNPNKKEQTISMATIEDRKYGDESFTLPTMTDQGQTVTWSSSDVAIVNINGQTATILKAGDVTLTATSEETNEYMDFSKDYTVSIAKAKLKISAQNCTKYMGDDNPEFTVIYSGFVNNDNAGVLSALPVVTTTANHNSPVGEYTISVSGAMAENYDIEYANGTLTIIDKMDSIMASTNKLELKDFTAYTNKQVIMPIELKNENEITGVQFKLVLPEGISVALNNKQKLMVNKTERSSEHTIGRSIETDGIYTILLHSTELDVFAGTEGSIVDITLDIDKDLAIGEYTVTLSDIVLSTPDAVKIKPNDITGKINVKRCQTGDPNNDGDIDVTDIIAIANYILGREMQNEFFVEAADVDGDGVIDVNDIVGIANIILFGNTPSNIAGAKGIYASEINNDYLLLTQKDNGQVTVNLKSHQHYTSFQMDIRVPDNMNIENIIMNSSNDHVMNYARLDNGYYRILVYSVSNNDLSNNDGTLLTLIGNGLTTDGITLENVTFSNSSQQKFQLPWRTESTTGLQGISETLLDKPMDIYTVNGKLIRKGVSSTKGLKKGLYIIGKKIVTIE